MAHACGKTSWKTITTIICAARLLHSTSSGGYHDCRTHEQHIQTQSCTFVKEVVLLSVMYKLRANLLHPT
jgi:hypothetical protein